VQLDSGEGGLRLGGRGVGLGGHVAERSRVCASPG